MTKEEKEIEAIKKLEESPLKKFQESLVLPVEIFRGSEIYFIRDSNSDIKGLTPFGE